MKKRRVCKIDRYADIIHAWLIKDLKEWKKQRHTAHRIWERLVKEIGANICESSVRAFVAKERSRIKAERDAMGYMDLE
ncbi:hypothetical protein [Atopobium sp. oral taxon 810]|uniref:hypothetical protein n=1 Tax=Atopobium sp. oral taxon 810 TaxID=712158 RepID=UPI00040635F7|nr:hypothetical protein [Atopobium sp. oral taxon 810]